jgi:hypothetical protein
MDIYHIWCDLKAGISDIEFTEAAAKYLNSLVESNSLASYRITRRKLGLGLAEIGEFHLMLEYNDLAQLDKSFASVASRADPIESFHFYVNSKVAGVKFALYRDFPDPIRQTGQEKF